MLVKDVGEFGLIDLLKSEIDEGQAVALALIRQRGFELKIPVGDDAAAWLSNTGMQILTTDTMVEDVHFRKETISWIDLGWKAMAVNLSDIAAMGCAPVYTVVTLGLTDDLPVDGIIKMYRGIIEAGNVYGSVVVGGDVVRSPVMFVTLAMIGTAVATCDTSPVLLTRDGALPGHKIAVTGHLGCSAAGLRVIKDGIKLEHETRAHVIAAHNRPIPKIYEGMELVRQGVTTAMDVSDGLIDDLRKICERSKVGAVIKSDWLPVDSYLRQVFPHDWLDLAQSGGEDYELLFTAPARIVDAVSAAVDVQVTVIGEIVNQPKIVNVLDSDGNCVISDRTGWDHLSRGNLGGL